MDTSNSDIQTTDSKPQEVVVSTVSLPAAVSSYFEANNRERRSKARWDKIKTFIEVCSLLALVTYVAITVKTLNEIREQTGYIQQSAKAAIDAAVAAQQAVEQARNHFRQDQRPYITLAPAGTGGKMTY